MLETSPIQRFWRLLRGYKSQIQQIYGYAILNGLVNLSLPLGIQAIINYIITGEVTMSWIILVCVVLTGIAVNGLIQVAQLRIVENIQQDIFTRSAFDFAYRLPRISVEQLDKKHTPELVNRFFDTMTVQKGLPKILIDFSLSSFTILFGLILLAIYNPIFIILAVALLFLLWLIYKVTGAKGLKTSLKESQDKYRIAHWLEEVARVSRSFKLNATHGLHIIKTDQIAHDYLNSRENHFGILLNQFKYIIGFKVFVAAALLVLGGLLVIDGQMNIGQFVAAEIIIILIINSIEKILRVIETIYDVLTALAKIGYITDLELDESDGELTPMDIEPLSIQAKNISFRFEGELYPVFENLNFDIQPNDKVVLSGPSGSGKTILLRALAGIQDVSYGNLNINNTPLPHYDRDDYFNRIGVVFPTNELFYGTILENITIGKKVDKAHLNNVLEHLGLANFLTQQPKGIYTVIDSGGRRLPRSVIQRLIIARALIKKPQLLLLEDPLQFIEEDHKSRLIDYLLGKEVNATVIVVADHEYWQQKCNKVIKLEKES